MERRAVEKRPFIEKIVYLPDEAVCYLMTKLSVNINKIATIRNARGGDTPNVVLAARRCQEFGAEGITVHPRPDARHITYQDVRDLRPVVTTEFNIEGYPSDSFLDLVCSVRPEQVTLVPDPPGALTSDSGWAVADHRDFLTPIVDRLHEAGIRVSLFVGTEQRHISAAAEIGADRIELYTEPYAAAIARSADPAEVVAPFVEAARRAAECGLGVNAGHDLNLDNLEYFVQHVSPLDEVSIGHALISDALYLGLEETVRRYLRQAHA